MKISIDQDDIEKDKIYVTLKEINAQVSTGMKEVFFAMTPDEADKLAFQLSSVLQDMEITKKDFDERRDMAKEERV